MRSRLAGFRTWAVFVLIVTVIILDAALEETRTIPAELMIIVRWTRDMLRYDARCIVQEKVRLMWRERTR